METLKSNLKKLRPILKAFYNLIDYIKSLGWLIIIRILVAVSVFVLSGLVFMISNRTSLDQKEINSSELMTEKFDSKANSLPGESDQKESRSKYKQGQCTVYVCGAVVNSGVYTLNSDLRIIDAVEAAGGLSDDADCEKVNLAAHLSDSTRIYIPHQADNFQLEDQLEFDGASSNQSKININTAGKEELMKLAGIGESRALDIISYRKENGPFKSCKDIMNVSGIKEAAYAKIKDSITI